MAFVTLGKLCPSLGCFLSCEAWITKSPHENVEMSKDLALCRVWCISVPKTVFELTSGHWSEADFVEVVVLWFCPPLHSDYI